MTIRRSVRYELGGEPFVRAHINQPTENALQANRRRVRTLVFPKETAHLHTVLRILSRGDHETLVHLPLDT